MPNAWQLQCYMKRHKVVLEWAPKAATVWNIGCHSHGPSRKFTEISVESSRSLEYASGSGLDNSQLEAAFDRETAAMILGVLTATGSSTSAAVSP